MSDRAAEPARNQQLGEGAAEGVAHDDRRSVESLDHSGEVVDRLRDRRLGDHRRVLPERLHLDLEAGVGGREDPEALGFVVGDPVLPASGGHPQAVDQDDRVGAGRVASELMESSWVVGSPVQLGCPGQGGGVRP